MSIRKGNNVIASTPAVDAVPTQNSTNAVSSGGVYNALATKQDTISDLATIRSGAAAGATAVQPGDLATVATTGNYNDLNNKPTIPAAQVNSDWNAVSGVAQILNKPTTLSGYGITDGANTSLSNLTAKGKNIGLWCNNASGIIAEIPQDIKLELNSGTLTLKAGSKAYKPDGTTYSATTDTNLDNAGVSGTNTWVIAMTGNNRIFPRLLANCVSGAGATTVAGYAYDTTTNKIHWFNASGVEQADDCSFPIAIIHTTSGVPDRIDQVFNEVGYIGSTVFALPNVKGLNPQGLNADGTLNNTTVTISSVMTKTLTSAITGATLVVDNNNLQANPLKVFDGTPDVSVATWCYSIKQNKLGVYTPSDQSWTQTGKIIVGTVNATTGGVITSLNQKTTFHAVDYNDTEFIAHQAGPSNRYVDLTLPASGGTVTAPADGYLSFAKSAQATEYISLINYTNGMSTTSSPSVNGNNARLFMRVSKGDVINLTYNASGTTVYFRFIYANGSK